MGESAQNKVHSPFLVWLAAFAAVACLLAGWMLLVGGMPVALSSPIESARFVHRCSGGRALGTGMAGTGAWDAVKYCLSRTQLPGRQVHLSLKLIELSDADARSAGILWENVPDGESADGEPGTVEETFASAAGNPQEGAPEEKP